MQPHYDRDEHCKITCQLIKTGWWVIDLAVRISTQCSVVTWKVRRSWPPFLFPRDETTVLCLPQQLSRHNQDINTTLSNNIACHCMTAGMQYRYPMQSCVVLRYTLYPGCMKLVVVTECHCMLMICSSNVTMKCARPQTLLPCKGVKLLLTFCNLNRMWTCTVSIHSPGVIFQKKLYPVTSVASGNMLFPVSLWKRSRRWPFSLSLSLTYSLCCYGVPCKVIHTESSKQSVSICLDTLTTISMAMSILIHTNKSKDPLTY